MAIVIGALGGYSRKTQSKHKLITENAVREIWATCALPAMGPDFFP